MGAQTTEINLDGAPLTRRAIEQMIDTMNMESIVKLMTREKGNVDWTPLIAMDVYNRTTGLYPIKDNKNYFKNCQTGNRRLDFIDSSIPRIILRLTNMGILTSSISKEWRSKQEGHEMYSIEYVSGSETQYYMQDGDSYCFKSQEEAEHFVDLFQKILDIVVDGKNIKPYTANIVIVVRKVAKRMEIKR